jgi:hypothetical protein
VLEELQKDPWPVPPDQRASRCTSTALSVAACLLGACVPGSGARILAFIGGPSTEGLGAVRTLFPLIYCFIYLIPHHVCWFKILILNWTSACLHGSYMISLRLNLCFSLLTRTLQYSQLPRYCFHVCS